MGRAFSFAAESRFRDDSRSSMPKFRNFKERGEWVEAQFIAEALGRGFTVLKPWGDSRPFDVALNFGNRIVRVQVKSTSYRLGTGYRCEFQTNFHGRQYNLQLLDLFAAYVIPQKTWYLIPAPVLFSGGQEPTSTMLFPMQPHNPDAYRYERYREAWRLLRPKPEGKKPR
jgi:PD-(D/E)XK nuclease superfamily protein